jgi:predicted CXXCH cytochrome family protein
MPFREAGLEACIECHNHHAIEKPTDDMVGVGAESVCMDCHAAGDPAYNVASVMHDALTTLVSLNDSAVTMKAHVARIGMDEVDIEFLLKDAHQSLIQARTLVHSFDASVLTEKTDEGVTKAKEAIELAGQQIEEHRTRRLGFAVAAFFATLLLIALYLKLRDIERVSPTS